MSKSRLCLIALVLFALVSASCGDDDEGGNAEGGSETTTGSGGGLGDGDESGDDPCEDLTLEATDTGVTEDSITVFVMADTGSELAPGLFQGSIDGISAWVDKVNDEGGLGCREVELIEWDSAISPTETQNGFLNACDTSLVMVGSTALLADDATSIEECGIANVPERAVSAAQECSPNVVEVTPGAGRCPYDGTGPRDYLIGLGSQSWILENEFEGGPVEAAIVIPSDTPATVNGVTPTVEAVNSIGIESFPDGEFGMSGLAEQAQYGAIIQYMDNADVRWAQSFSNDQSMLKWRNEAAAQNFDDEGVAWVCWASCYTPEFLEQGGQNVEGTYVALSFLPFDETAENEELATFMDHIQNPFPPSWAASAWTTGLLLEGVIDEIVNSDGPNAITRQRVLDGLKQVENFDANGWFGPANIAEREPTACFVLTQVEDGEFVRRHPEEPGTLDCETENAVIEDLDPAGRYQG